jgi:hypothetical protein
VIPHIAGSERRPPEYSFPRGTGVQSAAASARDIAPGPGQYTIPSAVGKQVRYAMTVNNSQYYACTTYTYIISYLRVHVYTACIYFICILHTHAVC